MQTEVSDMGRGLAGGLADGAPHDIVTRINTSGAAIPCGVFVTKGTGEESAELPNAATDITGLVGLGVTVQTHGAARNGGYADKAAMSVIKRGRVLVLVEDAVTAESAAFVRFTATAAQQAGAFRSNADTNTAAALPGAKFVSDAGPGELAVLDLNLP